MEKSIGDENYWREQHAKHSGKPFEEVETDLALEYEKGRPEDALPWDHVRPSVKATWDRIGGVISPRDPDRGTRSGI